MGYRSVKTVLDIVLSLILIIIVSPILIVAAVAVIIDSGRPVFFKQTRVGKDTKDFPILKFRTMHEDDDRHIGQTFLDSEGVTRVGKVLRRLKIDELPQLFSVLIGDMSIVGPRPCLRDLLSEMDQESLHRFSVKPGVTGLAQVNGNVKLSWPERWRYDLEYVENCSFFLDVKILFKTVSVVIFGERKSGEV